MDVRLILAPRILLSTWDDAYFRAWSGLVGGFSGEIVWDVDGAAGK
jgi:hypothetical protein